MDPKKWLLVVIILVGGTAVLGSYAWGVATHTDPAEMLWGGVPEGVRQAYTVGMVIAAVGYFPFTYFILFRLPSERTRIGNRFGYGLFHALYALILIPSALWIPLTFLAIEQASQGLAWLVRLVLLLVAAGSLGLLWALLKVQPREPKWAHKLAVGGAVFFCFQTVVLDAIVWASAFGV